MRTSRDKTKFIQLLQDTPFIGPACRRAGVSRATIYRWMKSDPKFKKEVDDALAIGRDQLIDVAEVALVQLIKQKNMAAIRFYLEHNSPRYYYRKTADAPKPLVPRQLNDWEQCDVCGETHVPRHVLDEWVKDLKNGKLPVEPNSVPGPDYIPEEARRIMREGP